MDYFAQILFVNEHSYFENSVHSDGSFVWSQSESKLTLSKELFKCLAHERGTLSDLLNAGLFLSRSSTCNNGLYTSQELIADQDNNDLIILFKYRATVTKGVYSGSVFLFKPQHSLSAFKPAGYSLVQNTVFTDFVHDVNNSLAVINSVVDWIRIKKLSSLMNESCDFEKKLGFVTSSVENIQRDMGVLEAFSQVSGVVNENLGLDSRS